MPIHFHDIIGFFGIALIVGSYLCLQMGRIASRDLSYSVANALGAFCVLFSLVFAFSLSAFLVEMFWAVISVIGIIRCFARDRDSSANKPSVDTGRVLSDPCPEEMATSEGAGES